MKKSTSYIKRGSPVLILLICSVLLSCAPPLQAKEEPENCNDCLQILNRHEGHQFLARVITTKSPYTYNSREDKEKAFSLFIELWKRRDGGLGALLSDSFLDILPAEPELFFSGMKKEPTQYDAWLSNLDSLSFVWGGDLPSPLEKKQQDLISFLEKITDLDEDIDPLRIKLLDALKEIEPRIVD